MTWRALIADLYRASGRSVRVEFRPPLSLERISAIEHDLGLPLPRPLRELLSETDGFIENSEREGVWRPLYFPLWSSEDILTQNREIREEANILPPSNNPSIRPLYFADAGVDGILFALLVDQSGDEDPAVYAWYPIEQEWQRISPSLADHLRGEWTV